MNRIPGLGSSTFKRAEYTGENRCTPCTIVNLVITGAISLAIGVLSPPGGVLFAGIAIITIYFRGYLIPGTPALTKRYFPDRVLRWFDKSPVTTLETDVDPEAQLLALGVIEPDGDDLRLKDVFASAWESAIGRTNATPEAVVGDVLDLGNPEIRETRDGWAVIDENEVVATWSSRAGLLADIAAIPLLRTRTDNWTALSEPEQTQLLGNLRIFLESCPSCEGQLGFYEATTESCCRDVEVTTYECRECHDQLMAVRQ